MALIVVAGTENGSGGNPTTVAVVDASNPAAATVTMLQPQIGITGARVAIDNGLLAVGAVLTGTVKLFDVTSPGAPVTGGSVNTALAGIGALAVRGTLIAAGEWTSSSGARVKLVDGSVSPPSVVSTAATSLLGNTVMAGSLPAISSIAFLSDTLVIAAGPTSGQIFLIDFTNRTTPVVTFKNTLFASVGSADADAAAQQIAAGDGGGGQVRRFNASVLMPTTQNTMLGGIGSLSLSAPRAIAGSPNDPNVALVDFTAAAVTRFNAQLNGGATAVIRDRFIALGSILGPFGASLGRIQFFDANATGAPLGHADVDLASISTIGIGQTTDVTASPSAVDVGTVGAGLTVPTTVIVKNSGSIARHVTVAAITAASGSGTFAIVPPTPSIPMSLTANGGTQTISLLFTGGAAVGAANATLSLTTDDPAAPSITVSLVGHVGKASASFSPATLAFMSVPSCQSKNISTTLSNTGTLNLTVTGVSITGDPRLALVTPPPAPTGAAPLVVAPGAHTSLSVRFAPVGAAGAIPAAASLALTSNDPAAPTVAITGSAVASPPSLSLSAASFAFGTIPVNSVLAFPLILSNTSACATLNATLALTTGAPFSVQPSGSGMTGAVSQTVAIAAGSSSELAIAFAPTAPGPFADTITITHNDPNQGALTVSLTAAAAVAPPTALELVLDRSGSMLDTVPGGTKMSSLQQAVHLFTSLVPFANGDELGVVAFDSAANTLAARAAWSAAQESAVTSAVNALVPLASTSIGAGLDTGRSDLSGSTVARRAMLVFTDGMENTSPMIAQALPTITQAGIEVYAVGLGRPADISTAALSALAVDSHGKFFNTDDALVLRKQFLQVLADSFRQNVAADPVVTLTSTGRARLAVNLTRCDRSVTFAVSWDSPQSSIQLRLSTPQGTVLTSSSPAVNHLVECQQGATYAWIRVRFAPLDPGSGRFLDPAPAGRWTLEVAPVSLAGASERVAMSALVESDVRLTVDIRASNTASGVQLSAALVDGANPVPGAKVQARIKAPTSSLAAAMTPQVVAQALGADQHGGRPLRPSRAAASRTVAMPYSARLGRYTVQLPASLDGVYQIEVLASGSACSGTFDRYASYSVYIAPRQSGSGPAITVTPSFPGTGVVTVVPTTTAGVPMGPGFAHLIQASVSGKGVASDVVDYGNGTYGFRVYWSPRAKNPTVTVVVAGRSRTLPLSRSTARASQRSKPSSKKSKKKRVRR